jgi:hypothetical protein
MAIDVKDAIKRAITYVMEVAGSNGGNWIAPPLLEEVEPTEDGLFWLVTVSYPISTVEHPVVRRVFKVVKLDRTTGEVLSMKIRELQADPWR